MWTQQIYTNVGRKTFFFFTPRKLTTWKSTCRFSATSFRTQLSLCSVFFFPFSSLFLLSLSFALFHISGNTPSLWWFSSGPIVGFVKIRSCDYKGLVWHPNQWTVMQKYHCNRWGSLVEYQPDISFVSYLHLTFSFFLPRAIPYLSLFFPPSSGVPRGVWGVQTPPPEIPKSLQYRAKLNLILKTIKNCWI